ncbi:disulfide bond formation protein DsbA [Pseudomonas agarici]|uniref:Disulfide bond formation protein DsbA n=1 Tax=Pseudomonas agarici TaxID=46677 RepID=A0A0X1T1X5_PSEAA|nr:thioredoxin domain-containing protein [Pseudomonas agarici]AMB86011.1 disulfide bond formation protein DsbA [Pseudomonas agarici]
MIQHRKRWTTGGWVVAGLVAACFSLFQGQLMAPQPSGPWVFGPSNARWTIIEYADLECPYCKTYTPVLKSWVLQQKDVNLQWHHLPLGFHGTAAVQEARRTECAGRMGGAEAFWQAVDQTFERTRSNGQGFAGLLDIAGIDSDDLEICSAENQQVALHIDQQTREAASSGIDATPSLVVRDNTTGKSVKLEGPADGVTLLSAIDWLANNSGSSTAGAGHSE